ncbi:MAG: hypothetical protein J6Y43_08065 [Clostridia bacterium]|nr:hypothetical protein [Clostridia bacterium]
MKKILQKVACFAIAVCTVVSFTACGPKQESFDTTKTQIFVGNYDGGLGDAWLKKVAAEFEKDYADYELNGKVGVEIIPDSQKDKFDGNNLISGIAGNSNEIFFTEKVDLPTYISRGYLADINDVVLGDLGTLPNNSSESGKTIESKILVNKDYLKGDDGHYYGLPFYEGYYTLIYNVDLFDKLLAYFKDGFEAETALEDKFVGTLNEKRSKGPDGKYGTYDDGLPETYEDFYDLCDFITLNNDTKAITYPGAYMHYWLRFMYNLWANNEGAEQMALNFSLSGTATNLINVSGGVITNVDDLEITKDNAEYLQKQKGKYEALTFVNTLAKNTKWFPTNVGSLTQSRAQENFVLGTYESSMEDIAMILDGNWFGSEAKGVIADAKNKYTDYNANYAIMPLPKASRETVNAETKAAFLGTNDSFCFINKNAPTLTDSGKMELVKKFLMYCHSDKCLSIFTDDVGMARPFSYTVADESALSAYAKSVYNVHKQSDVVYPYSSNPYVRANSGSSGVFYLESWAFGTTVNNNATNPFTTFKDTSVTVEQYFNGMYERQSRALHK